jgi:hypothetical protein
VKAPRNTNPTQQKHEDEISRMVGDVNLFLNDSDDVSNAELDVMIAEPSYRRLAITSELTYLNYACIVDDRLSELIIMRLSHRS